MLSGVEFPELPLPPYSGIFTRCVKCGLTGRPGSKYVDLRPLLAEADTAPPSDYAISPNNAQEYQKRTCGNCDYTWAEDVAR